MKTRKIAPSVAAATLTLFGWMPAMAGSPPLIVPATLPLGVTPALVVEPQAAADFSAIFIQLKQTALLEKHDLISEANRVEHLDAPALATASSLLATRDVTPLIQAASYVANQPPVTSTTDEGREPESAALSNTTVKAKRPSGSDGRNFGKRNRWA